METSVAGSPLSLSEPPLMALVPGVIPSPRSSDVIFIFLGSPVLSLFHSAGEMFVYVSDRVLVPVLSAQSLKSTVPVVFLQMVPQYIFITESLVLPTEPTEVLDPRGVGGPVLDVHVELHLQPAAAQHVPVADEARHSTQLLGDRDNDQSLRLVLTNPVLSHHVGHGVRLDWEYLRTVPTLDHLLQVSLRYVGLQLSLAEDLVAVRALNL